jgi:transmembrane sensor
MKGYNDSDVDYELLGRYLAGECSADEASRVVAWLSAKPENQATLDALREVWNLAEAEKPAQEVDVDAAWSRVQGRLQSGKAPEMRLRDLRPQAPMRAQRFLRVAAMLFVALSIGLVFFLLRQRGNPSTEVLAWVTTDATLSDTLPDGTVVTLNRNSRLDFPARFAGNERVVALQGEAFFDVAHDSLHPFRIHADGADVKVLGTQFNLRNVGGTVRVEVASGKVEFSEVDSAKAGSGKKVVLTAGMAATYNEGDKEMQHEAAWSENDLFWKTGRLVFQNRPLRDVVAELNQVLGDSIAIADAAIGDCRLTTTFERPSIVSALDVIQATFNFTVAFDGKMYLLNGTSCK